MEALRGSGLRNALVTVTRYFGGIKLGTGGLVHAYSACCRKVLDIAPRAALRQEKLYRVTVPYEYFESVKRVLLASGCRVTGEAFAEEASLAVFIADDAAADILAAVRDTSRGKEKIEQ
jgi:putative IMPACT (imprinted ancient) family translation regulator